jgi:exopolysaccharide production protein ExoZ
MKPSRYYYHIDIIRFLSALSVVCFHFGYINEVADFQWAWPITWFGWIGVETFFVISGFVIANSAKNAGPVKFLIGRALRLWPAVWLCATITLIFHASDNLLFPYVRSMMLLPKGPWISPVYWTLAVEIVFYTLIFALLCLKGFTSLNRVALGLTLFSSAYLLVLWLRFFHISEHLNVFLLRHGCFFALGLWLWLSTTRPLLRWERAAVVLASMASLLEICLKGLEFLPTQALGPVWIIVPILVWGAAVAWIGLGPDGGSFFTPRTAAVIRALGLMTFPLYLVHDEIGRRTIEMLLGIGVNKWIALTSGTLFVILLSWIICIYWEPPARKALSLAFDKLTAALGKILQWRPSRSMA